MQNVRFLETSLLIGMTVVAAYADVPSGIVGGVDGDSNAFSALVYYSSGDASTVSGLAMNGEINVVAINESGASLIGGELDSTSGFAAQVSASGDLNVLSLGISSGSIYGTAINASGAGLIGGQNEDAGYAAQISADGTVNPLTFTNDIIYSVAINDAGVGLIGGEGTLAPYAAFVDVNGTVTQITLSDVIGAVSSVDINSSGNAILGGIYDTSEPFSAYAVFAPAGGGSVTLLSPLPTSSSYISSVAINDAGLGLIGGQDENGDAYAGYAITDGTVTPLFGSPFGGYIQSVAMNSSGNGIIGGQHGMDLYAAFVQPDGTMTTILDNTTVGMVKSVAISEAGVGLIGGQVGDVAYATFVAPNGSLTPIDVSANSIINSVAINDVVGGTTPQSTGPYLSVIYTQLAAVSALEARFIEQNPIWSRSGGTATARANSSQELVAGSIPASAAAKPMKKNTFWLTPFGDYVNLKAQGSIPQYSNTVGGALLAYDHQDTNYLVGASLGYAFNYVGYSNGLGHGKVQEEMASFYGAYNGEHVRFVGVLWGGVYQFYNTRHTLSMITSKATAHGWIFDPHVEIASPWAIDQQGCYYVEPFFMFDWVNNWQGSYTETGSAGFNLQMPSHYASLLQSEVGLRFYERLMYGWGDVCLEEKFSYINMAPFHFNSVTTSFVASTSTFPIAIGSPTVENLGAIHLLASFVPKNKSYYGGFSGQVTANGSYQSYFGSLFGGVHF